MGGGNGCMGVSRMDVGGGGGMQGGYVCVWGGYILEVYII